MLIGPKMVVTKEDLVRRNAEDDKVKVSGERGRKAACGDNGGGARAEGSFCTFGDSLCRRSLAQFQGHSRIRHL
jgi:hypothetical protein